MTEQEEVAALMKELDQLLDRQAPEHKYTLLLAVANVFMNLVATCSDAKGLSRMQASIQFLEFMEEHGVEVTPGDARMQ